MQGIVLKESCENLITYYKHLRISTTRYFPLSEHGISLFDHLSSEEDSSLRKVDLEQSLSIMFLKNALEKISKKVRCKIDETVGSDARNNRFVQIISSGRSGTYFLRTQLLTHSEKIVPIHNILTIPSLNIRSLLSIIQIALVSESNKNVCISNAQLTILSNHLEKHLLLFCLELIGYSNRLNKLPVIINHWWSPFAVLLKSILPRLEFISLTRDRECLEYSMVEKY